MERILKAAEPVLQFISGSAYLFGIGLALLYLLTVAFLLHRAKEERITVPKYLSLPPDNATPVEAVGLAYEGRKISASVVLATFIDLAERGIYKMHFGTFADTAGGSSKALEIKFERSSLISISKDLKPHERSVRNFFDELLGNKILSLSEMKQEILKERARWNTRWKILNKRINQAAQEAFVWEDISSYRFKKIFRGLLISLWVIIGISLIAYPHTSLLFVAAALLPLPAAIVLLGIFAPKHLFHKLSSHSRRRSLEWQAFARWTEDLPRMSEKMDIELKLWPAILNYAIAFGTADHILESAALPSNLQIDLGGGKAIPINKDSFVFTMIGFADGFARVLGTFSSEEKDWGHPLGPLF